jgi:hypothetical protein
MERLTMRTRNRGMQFMLALLMAGIFLGIVSAQEMPKGEWRAEFQTGGEQIWLQIHWENSGSSHTWGNTWKVSEVWGLDPNLSIGTHANMHFEVRRDAGTITFTGDFDKGVGMGQVTFAPSAEFISGMKTLGYADLSSDQIFSMAEMDISRDYVKQMRELGYRDLSADMLIRLKAHGVSAEYAAGMRGVGLKDLSAEQLIDLRNHGASVEFVKGMSDAGVGPLSVEQIIQLRNHGVMPEYVKEMASLGMPKLGVDQLVTLKNHGVSVEFVRGMKDAGYTQVDMEQLVEMRNHGVSPEYVKDMRAAGLDHIEYAQLIRLREHGVSADFVRELKDLGYANVGGSAESGSDCRLHSRYSREGIQGPDDRSGDRDAETWDSEERDCLGVTATALNAEAQRKFEKDEKRKSRFFAALRMTA